MLPTQLRVATWKCLTIKQQKNIVVLLVKLEKKRHKKFNCRHGYYYCQSFFAVVLNKKKQNEYVLQAKSKNAIVLYDIMNNAVCVQKA